MRTSLAILRRRHAEHRAKSTGKRMQTAVTRALGDLPDRHRTVRQITGRVMQPQPPHSRSDRLAIHRLINSMPVIRRQTGNFRQILDIERLIEMIVNMVKHACQPRFIPGTTTGIVHERADKKEPVNGCESSETKSTTSPFTKSCGVNVYGTNRRKRDGSSKLANLRSPKLCRISITPSNNGSLPSAEACRLTRKRNEPTLRTNANPGSIR